MKLLYTAFILLVSLLLNSKKLQAQATKPIVTIKTHAFKVENKVYLRWVLSNAKEWRLANQKGFIIERAEEGKTNYQKLTTSPLKPITEQTALKYGKKSNAYALYSIINKLPNNANPKELKNDEQTYPLFLVLSIFNPINPILSASGFIDSTIDASKAYTYRVSVADMALQNQNTATIATSTTNSLAPSMPDITASFGDKKVELLWDIKSVMQEYPAVVLERSTDSISFTSVSNIPLLSSLINTDDKQLDTSKHIMTYNDENLENKTKYYYRIRGINIFGLYSPPSKIVAGECVPDFKTLPRIVSVDTLASRFIITWKIIDSLKPLIKKYEIWSSEIAEDSTYKKIADIVLEKPTSDLQFAFKYTPKETNYFVVKAILKKDNSAVKSLPFLYLLKDSIPPAIPINIQASIDSTGNVSIAWAKNREEDISGYKIYRSLTGTNAESFTAIFSKPIVENVFKEKVTLKQLNRDIYYRVSALDNKYNESPLSDFILVQRPDIIPPAAAILKNIQGQNNNTAVRIQWTKSVSKDVKNYGIYRKKLADSAATSWQEVYKATNVDTVYTDNAIEAYTSYEYKIQAIDSSNLKSNFSRTLLFVAPKQVIKVKTITNLNSYVSRDKKYIELNWNVPNADILEIVIYRVVNRNEDDMVLLATVPASTKIYDDENIKENNVYTYYLKPVFKNGKSGELQKIDVEY